MSEHQRIRMEGRGLPAALGEATEGNSWADPGGEAGMLYRCLSGASAFSASFSGASSSASGSWSKNAAGSTSACHQVWIGAY